VRFKAIIGCAVALWLMVAADIACGSPQQEMKPISWDPAPYALVKTMDWEHIALEEFTLWNGPWGKGSIVDYRQWVFKVVKDSTVPFGWKWDWPKERLDDVKAYQSLSYGWSPWADVRTNTILPMKIGNIAELRVDYETVVNASGKYNLSFDLWIAENFGNTDPKELNVSREFMVWVDSKEVDFDPYWYVGIVTIGGEEYIFYRIEGLKGTLRSRDFMVFVKKTPMLRGSIDMEDFLAYLLGKNYLTEDEYLKNIDFGDEVWYGEGEATINRFDVSLTAK
jgi:hypothetical protein